MTLEAIGFLGFFFVFLFFSSLPVSASSSGF